MFAAERRHLSIFRGLYLFQSNFSVLVSTKIKKCISFNNEVLPSLLFKMLSEISSTGRKFWIIFSPLFLLIQACPEGQFCQEEKKIPEPSTTEDGQAEKISKLLSTGFSFLVLMYFDIIIHCMRVF